MEENNNLETTENLNFESRIDLQPLLNSIVAIKNELETVIVGQSKMIDQLLVATFLVLLVFSEYESECH